MIRTIAVGVVLSILACPLSAQTSTRAASSPPGLQDVKPVSCGPADMLYPPVMIQARKLSPAGAESGLSEKALAGDAQMPGQTDKCSMAIDFPADGDEPDKVFFDFSGSGKFDKSAGIPVLKAETRKPLTFMVKFGPADVKARRDGRDLIINVTGVAGKVGQDYLSAAILCSAVEGKCAFGSKEHAVRVIDTAGTYTYDRATGTSAIRGRQAGDIVQIDTGDGKFTSSVKAFLGQPVMVDGAWYEVSAVGGKLQAKAVEAKTSAVSVAADCWDAVLFSKDQPDRLFYISGGKEASLPAGEYMTQQIRLWAGKDVKAGSFALVYQQSKLIAEKDKTAVLLKPFPLKGVLAVEKPGAQNTGSDVKLPARTMVISYSLKTADDRNVSAMAGETLFIRVSGPEVAVTDESGKEVYKATMEFG